MITDTNRLFLQIICCVSLAVGSYGCARGPQADLSVPEQRAKAVDSYLAEFSAPSFMRSRIGPAIREVLLRMPKEALLKVMDRRRPVLFVDVNSSGTGRFASSSEVIVTEKDAPAFQEGLTLIKISDHLADGSSEAIRGIVAHEIAHRVLDHIRRNHVSCQAEREANRLIKSWGFTKEFAAASKEFGQAKVGDGVAGCQEAPEPLK
jgi:hypothetical protein